MVCEKRDCNLQSFKITFSSVHCHNVGTADSATFFRFAQSQNKKCKLKFIEKLEDVVRNWEKIPKNVWIVSKYFQHYSRSIVGWRLVSQRCNRITTCHLIVMWHQEKRRQKYCDLIHFLHKRFLQRNSLCFVFTYQARRSQGLICAELSRLCRAFHVAEWCQHRAARWCSGIRATFMILWQNDEAAAL